MPMPLSGGPIDYYAKTVGAIPIPSAKESIYRSLLRSENQ